MSFDLNYISELIAEKGLKLTQQRIVVYQSLLSFHNHPGVEEVYDVVKKSNPSISLATIYKTLETFAEVGLVKKVSTSKGMMRYDANIKKHSHIYVTNTDEIVDYFDDELTDLISKHLQRKKIKNLNITDVRLHIKGEKIDASKDISIS